MSDEVLNKTQRYPLHSGADIAVDKVVLNCFGLQGGVAFLEGGGAAHIARLVT